MGRFEFKFSISSRYRGAHGLAPMANSRVSFAKGALVFPDGAGTVRGQRGGDEAQQV